MILTKEKIQKVDLDLLAKDLIANSQAEKLLYIVPTNRRARNLKKEIVSSSPNEASFHINIETLSTIGQKILSEIIPFKKMSEAASTVFLRQISAKLKFRYLSLYQDEIPFGTIDKIKNVISEYKRHGITPSILRIESEKLETAERNKALDIADFLEQYQLICSQLNAFEDGDIYSRLIETEQQNFSESFRILFPSVETILINEFSEFSLPEMKLIEKLSFCGKTFINFDYTDYNPNIFSHLEKCFFFFDKSGFNQIDEAEKGKKDLSYEVLLGKSLFKSGKTPHQMDMTESIFKFSAFNKEKEIEIISKEIKKIITQNNIEPSRFCLCFNNVQDYSSIVKDVFEKNGIPFNLTDRTPLNNSYPIAALISFLEIAENDYYYKNLFRALNSGFLDTRDIDNTNLFRVASEFKIVAGKENWQYTIKDAIANLVHQGDDERSEAYKNSLLKAQKDFDNIIKLLEPFEQKMTIGEFIERLNSFITQSNLAKHLLKTGDNLEENIRAFSKLLDTINEIFELLSEELGADKKHGLSFFMDQIRTACNWARFNVKEKTNYGVLVTSLDEIRGLKWDYLFVAGLNDGILPTRFNPEIFFSGSFKKQAATHQTEERYLFYRTLKSWQKKLYLSYTQADNGKETIPSTFIKDFEKVFTISELDYSYTEQIIFSEEDRLINLGNSYDESTDDNSGYEVHINNKIRINKMRELEPFKDSSYCGIITADDDDLLIEPEFENIKKEMAAYLNKQYSVSQLETYAKCPYKFFLEKVIGIEVIEEPTEDIEAIEMGRLLHAILYEFYTNIKKKKIVLANCDQEDFSKAKKILFEIAEKELKNTAFKAPLTFYEKEKILGLDGIETNSILYRFLEHEREGEGKYIPEFFEVGFGKLRKDDSDLNLSTQEPIEVEGIKLRGKIDRIEVDYTNSSFNITDYKIGGKTPTFEELKEGLSLQLPVYLYAASILLSKKFGKKFSANQMFIYSLKYSSDSFGKNPISLGRGKENKFDNIDEAIENSLKKLVEYVRSIAEGKFGLTKIEDREVKVCRNCNFRMVCRIDDIAK